MHTWNASVPDAAAGRRPAIRTAVHDEGSSAAAARLDLQFTREARGDNGWKRARFHSRSGRRWMKR